MNGKRAKQLRTEERPNPGRKHGGTTKEDVRAKHVADRPAKVHWRAVGRFLWPGCKS